MFIVNIINYLNNKISNKLCYIYNNIYKFEIINLVLYTILIILFFPVLYTLTGVLTLFKFIYKY